jgi:uncharacterized protein YdaU (DUF1376 family)
MSEAPSFPLYANDFVGGRVATYELAEIGAYSLLLAFDWTLNGLPTETEKLAKLCRVSHRKFLKIWEVIGEQFPERDGRRFNPRLALERAKKGIKSAQATDAAAKRWQSDRNADASTPQYGNDATTTSTSSLPGETKASGISDARDPALVLVIAANKGLADHPTRPQRIPRIIATQPASRDASDAILQAGVPTAFAESQVYALARSHNADSEIRSLRYFVPATIRAWQQQLAADEAARSDAPAGFAALNGAGSAKTAAQSPNGAQPHRGIGARVAARTRAAIEDL